MFFLAFGSGFNFVSIFVIIIFILTFSLIIFSIVSIFNPKLRAKFMKRHIRASKDLINEVKDDLVDLGAISSSIGIEQRKRVLDENEDVMKDISRRNAEINSEGVRVTAKAIKDGLSDNSVVFCKHCGKKVDSDSKFCKYCGKTLV